MLDQCEYLFLRDHFAYRSHKKEDRDDHRLAKKERKAEKKLVKLSLATKKAEESKDKNKTKQDRRLSKRQAKLAKKMDRLVTLMASLESKRQTSRDHQEKSGSPEICGNGASEAGELLHQAEMPPTYESQTKEQAPPPEYASLYPVLM